MNFFHHKDLGNHLLQLCPKVVKHPVYTYVYVCVCVCIYIYMYIYILTLTNSNTHTHTHTHAHTHAHTNTHTHTLLHYGTKATCTMSEGFSILFKVLKFFSSLKALTCSVTYLTCLFNEHSGKMPRHESHQSLASSADVRNT